MIFILSDVFTIINVVIFFLMLEYITISDIFNQRIFSLFYSYFFIWWIKVPPYMIIAV